MRKLSTSTRKSIYRIGFSLALASVTGCWVISGTTMPGLRTGSLRAIAQSIEDQRAEADRLLDQGEQQYYVSQWREALQSFQAALEIYQELGDRAGEGGTLNNIGVVYEKQGRYEPALEVYQQSLTINREVGDRAGEGITLSNIGAVYDRLGRYEPALEVYQQSLTINREVGNRAGEGVTLNNIGLVYNNLGRYEPALEVYEQSLIISREIGDRAGERGTLSNIGTVYANLGRYDLALEVYEQSLTISREIGDRAGEGTTLNNIGGVYNKQENYDEALQQFQQALTIAQAIGDRAGEANRLGWIGRQLQHQGQIELAIIFYKKAINVQEAIRADLGSLPQEVQNSYTQTVEGGYRLLADLLLQQDRILEAQQVLDLLKVQELDDYLRGVRGSGATLTILRPEEEILERYNALQQTAIQVIQDLTALQTKLNEQGLSENELVQYDNLLALQEDLNNQFNTFLNSLEIQALANQLSPENKRTLEAAQRDALFNSLDDLQENLASLNAVLLYPLILDDRLELLITLPDPETPPLRRMIRLDDGSELTRAVSDLRQALRDPSSDAITPAQTLYSYLIEPLEADLSEVTDTLTNGEPPTIIYASDSILRYIPLAALHDGEQWLAQRFRINNITAESLTNLERLPTNAPRVLAGAFADPLVTHTVSVNGVAEDFPGLPFAGQEVENMVASLPQINSFFDDDFGWLQVRRFLSSSNIVHFATHAKFVPDAPEDSFILFGNGDRAILECLDGAIQTSDARSCINNWQLNNVDLVVLSACETGLADQLTDGKEVLSLGYQFQASGARAVIASLWKVSDGGTQALMTAFYTALQQPGITKTEALRQAQTALITGDFEILGLDERGAVGMRQRIQSDVPSAVASNLDHPYYWAPFILIGNGL